MNADTYEKFAARVKEACSFHLFAPMPEAYSPNLDVERFETTDRHYLTLPPQARPSWAIDLSLRPFHPKRYLEFLLAPSSYSEVKEGVDALMALNWQGVLKEPQQTLFLRSLFQDLAHALGLEMSRFPGDSHPLTSDHRNRNRILRNC